MFGTAFALQQLVRNLADLPSGLMNSLRTLSGLHGRTRVEIRGIARSEASS